MGDGSHDRSVGAASAAPGFWKHDGGAGDPGRPASTPIPRRRRAWTSRGDQSRPRRRAKALGRHGDDPCQRQDGRASSRGSRKRHLCREGQGADALGRRASSSSPRLGPGISSMSRPSCRTRKSTPVATRSSNACWCGATARPWWSTSISHRSKSRRTQPWIRSDPSAVKFTPSLCAMQAVQGNRCAFWIASAPVVPGLRPWGQPGGRGKTRPLRFSQ